jgi:hypothetical protein
MKYKNRRENEQNKEHDKIVQYFPQMTVTNYKWLFLLEIHTAI